MTDPRLKLSERLGVAALVGLGAWVLLGGDRLIGIANSGDFERVMSWGGVTYMTDVYTEKYFSWVVPTFKYYFWPPLSFGWYFSSEGLFVKAAATIAWFTNWNTFDLRWIGAVHLAAYAAALALLFRGWRAATGSSGLWLLPALALVLGDVGYLVYFHSFYSEPAAIIFLVATVGLGLQLAATAPADVTEKLLNRFFLALALFMTAKTQNLTLAAPIMAYAGWLWWRNPQAAWRPRVAKLGAGLVLLAIFQYGLNPPHMTEANKFATVFNGILKDSPDVKADLVALGLPPGFAPLAGHDIFWADRVPFHVHGAAFRKTFFGTHSHRKVVDFYMRHPDRFLTKLQVTASHSYTLRPGYLGNFPHSQGVAEGAKSDRWATWSRFKEDQLPHTLPFSLGVGFVAATGLGLAAVLDRGRLRRGPATFLLALVGMAAIAFVTPIIGDGESDMDKHMFLYNMLFDLGVVLASGVLASLALPRRSAS